MPGHFVSKDGKWWPEIRPVVIPSPERNGRSPATPVLGADGKPLMAPEPAAVEEAKLQLGFKKGEAVPYDQLGIPVMEAPENKQATMNDRLGDILAELVKQQGAARPADAPKAGARG